MEQANRVSRPDLKRRMNALQNDEASSELLEMVGSLPKDRGGSSATAAAPLVMPLAQANGNNTLVNITNNLRHSLDSDDDDNNDSRYENDKRSHNRKASRSKNKKPWFRKLTWQIIAGILLLGIGIIGIIFARSKTKSQYSTQEPQSQPKPLPSQATPQPEGESMTQSDIQAAKLWFRFDEFSAFGPYTLPDDLSQIVTEMQAIPENITARAYQSSRLRSHYTFLAMTDTAVHRAQNIDVSLIHLIGGVIFRTNLAANKAGDTLSSGGVNQGAQVFVSAATVFYDAAIANLRVIETHVAAVQGNVTSLGLALEELDTAYRVDKYIHAQDADGWDVIDWFSGKKATAAACRQEMLSRIDQAQAVARKRAGNVVTFLDCYHGKAKRCLSKARRDLKDLAKFENRGEGGNAGMTTDEREVIVTDIQDTWRCVEKLRLKVMKVV